MATPVLWQPSPERRRKTAMHHFTELVRAKHPNARVDTYEGLHRWSVDNPQQFWRLFLQFSPINHSGSVDPATDGTGMPGTQYFPRVELNFAQNLLRFDDDQTALVSISETRATDRISFRRLNRDMAATQAALRRAGVQAGDRIAGFVPNIHESVVAMLAASSLGAVWSSCSPDFGVQGVLDRFGQIGPKVLFAANGYVYGGKRFDCISKLEEILGAIDSIEHLVLIPYLSDHPTAVNDPRATSWNEFAPPVVTAPTFEPFAFNHPLYVMYSSGTTGIPKCIVHGAGGTLIQHTKELILHSDLNPGDNIMYFTTCGWMMWNWLISSLLTGATVTLFDGSPSHPGLERLWQLVADEQVTHFGTSPKFIGACRGGLRPGDLFDLTPLRVILSTGAPLLPEDFDWVYESVKSDVQLSSISGGTDIISCFMLGNPTLPVHRGEIQCLGLGMDVQALGDDDRPRYGEKGELACRTAFPCMPIYFWNDEGNARYRQAYFHRLPNVWLHGDFIEITGTQGRAGGIAVHGRSDATLNPGGIRIGTAEIYRLVETLPEIADSIVVGQPHHGDVRVVLFAKLAPGHTWSDGLANKIRSAIRYGATPRHVPTVIKPVADIPYTISGKKVELAVLQVLEGAEPNNKAALANPEALDHFENLSLD